MKYYNKNKVEISEEQWQTLLSQGKRFRLKSGGGVAKAGRHQFTDIEEAERDAEEAETLANKPSKIWDAAILVSDKSMIPRWVEDYVETEHGGTLTDSLLQKKYDDKKSLRATKPEDYPKE